MLPPGRRIHGVRRDSRSVIRHPQRQQPGTILEIHLHSARGGVLHRIEDRLAANAKGRRLNGEGQALPVAIDGEDQLGRAPGRGPGSMFQRIRQVPLFQLHRAHVPDHVTGIAQGGIRGGEDALQGLGALLRSLREHALDRAQLQRDARESLQQRVVQLLGDAGSLDQRRLIARTQSAGDLPHAGQIDQPDQSAERGHPDGEKPAGLDERR